MKHMKNLDVPGTSHDREIGCTKGIQDELAPGPHLSSLCASTAQPNQQREHHPRYRIGGTKYITVPQATNIIEAVNFAKRGSKKVWKRFRLRKEHCRLQGIIHGKRCGTTENIGLTRRARWRQSKEGVA